LKSRKELLEAILVGTEPINTVLRELAVLGWDSNQEFVTLHVHHVVKVLEEYLAGRRTAAAVEQWAEAIEGRDDIGLDASARAVLSEVIFELANPALCHPLTPLRARRILAMIGAESGC